VKIKKGRTYGISIGINDPYGLDPSHRYSLTVLTDPAEFDLFLSDDFYGFELPNKDCELFLTEDPTNPLIKR